jgi:hypothetical protein
VRGYLRQQRGYGFAEALLERKWPARFNALGHVAWPGNLYGSGAGPSPFTSSSIYGGTWGTAPYQSIYERPSSLAAAPLMPEWWLAIAGLSALGALGASWAPLWLGWLLALVMGAASVGVAGSTALDRLATMGGSTAGPDAVTLTWLVLAQSLARLRGRLAGGLTPWRRRGVVGRVPPTVRTREAWSEDWHAMENRLRTLEERLVAGGVATRRGGPTDEWDLETRTGSLGSARLLGTVEEHGHGRQMVRWRMWPRVGTIGVGAALGLFLLASLALLDGGVVAAAMLAAAGTTLLGRTVLDVGTSLAAIDNALDEPTGS